MTSSTKGFDSNVAIFGHRHIPYRFAFNGKEKDDEINGWQDYGERMYNRLIGRFPTPDPIIIKGKKYPELSPYQFASNRPIDGIDLDGLELYIKISEGAANAGCTKQSITRFTTVIKSIRSLVEQDPVMLDALSRMTKLDGKQILTELTYQEGVSTGKGVTFEVSQPKTIKGGAQNPSSNLVDIQFEPLMSFENMKRNDASFRTTAKSYFYVIMEEWAHAKDKAINNGHNSGQGILTGGDLETGVQDFQTSITGHRGTDPLLFFTGEYQSYNENGNWQINKFDFSKKSKFSEWPAKMGKRWNSNIEKIDNVIDNLK